MRDYDGEPVTEDSLELALDELRQDPDVCVPIRPRRSEDSPIKSMTAMLDLGDQLALPVELRKKCVSVEYLPLANSQFLATAFCPDRQLVQGHRVLWAVDHLWSAMGMEQKFSMWWSKKKQ